MNIYKIILGIILMLGSMWYYKYLTSNPPDDEDVSPIEKSFNIEIYFGLAVCFIIGLVMVFRELLE